MRTVLFAVLATVSCLSTTYAASSLFEAAKRDPLALVPSMQKLLKEDEAAAAADEESKVDYQNDDVNACNYSDEVLNRYRPHLYMVGLQEVARHDMHLAQDFAKAGYPESVWRPALAAFTKANVLILKGELRRGGNLDYYYIKKLMRPHEKTLVRKLEAYRKQAGREMVKFSSSPFCGGDFIGFFSIKTSPSGGYLRIIREYFFQLCVAEKIDPYSVDCDMWLTPTAKGEYPQGTYRYRVKWSDGPEECGKSDFLLDKQNDYIFNVAVERTNKACEK